MSDFQGVVEHKDCGCVVAAMGFRSVQARQCSNPDHTANVDAENIALAGELANVVNRYLSRQETRRKVRESRPK